MKKENLYKWLDPYQARQMDESGFITFFWRNYNERLNEALSIGMVLGFIAASFISFVVFLICIA